MIADGFVPPDAIERLHFAADVTTGCWLWNGELSYQGYGLSYWAGKPQRAHRLSWKIFNGPIPEGEWVLHRCLSRRCINPDHLYLGDHRANMADMVAQGHSLKGEKHGAAKLTEENVREIKRLFAKGIPNTRLGRMFGVATNTIRRIRIGRNWAHVVAEEFERRGKETK